MATQGPTPPPPADPGPPPPPATDASRDEWRTWRHQQRDYLRAHRAYGGWYGPGWFWFGAWGWSWGAILVLAGIYFLLSNLGLLNWIRGDVFWPLVLILLGVALILRRGRWWWR
ncbi:MAG TPA: DUF5668 domain-containing protein [Candidatus Dormibacteraeota bacterium]|nr:DUF5668 domain-containing protein [Candidatus Dormibacteraeota bacterium]